MECSVWEALSAIGTVIAVVVALGISVHSARASGKAEMDRAELAAAKMLSPLSSLTWKVSGLFAWFAFTDYESSDSDAKVIKSLDELDALANSITIEDLYPLLKLPSHAAKRSARALGLIHTFVNDVRGGIAHPSWVDIGATNKTAEYKRWFEMLSVIKDHLEISVRVCEASAQSGAPRPTSDEIHANEQGG